MSLEQSRLRQAVRPSGQIYTFSPRAKAARPQRLEASIMKPRMDADGYRFVSSAAKLNGLLVISGLLGDSGSAKSLSAPSSSSSSPSVSSAAASHPLGAAAALSPGAARTAPIDDMPVGCGAAAAGVGGEVDSPTET